MPLLRILLLAFPLIELASLILLGQAVGVGWTLFWVLFTGVLGLMLIQRQGWGMFQRLQQQMLANRNPGAVLKSGMWGVLAGALIAFPGLVSDVLAVPCLIMALVIVAAAPGRMPAATRVRGPTDTVNTPLSRASGRPARRPASRIPRVWEIAENFTGSTLEKRKAVPIKDARDFRPPVTGAV